MPNSAGAGGRPRDDGTPPAGARVASLESQVAALGGPTGRRRLRIGLNQVVVVIIVVAAFWLVYVFGSAVQQLNDANAREQAVQAETTALQRRLAADQREPAIVQSVAFQQLQARAYGLGKPGEQVFSLETNAPSPAPLPELGSAATSPVPETPLNAWLSLLFGD